MRRPDRLLYWLALSGSVLVAAFLLASGDKLLHISHFMEGSNIRLYLDQMRKAILALPFLLLWVQVSKRRAIVEALAKARQWWLLSPWHSGIADRGLRATMSRLGYDGVFYSNYGMLADLPAFENHAFVFARQRELTPKPQRAS